MPSTPKTKRYLFTIMSFMILAGAFNAIAHKTQNKQYVYEGVYYKEYFHPYMQVSTMFLGEFISLMVFFFDKYRKPEKYRLREGRAKEQGKSNKLNKLLIIIPAIADFITSTMHYTALNFIPGSVYQMMRGGTVITTLIFSILFLEKRVKKYQIVGCILVLSGIIVVAVSHFVLAHQQPEFRVDTKLQVAGYILVLALSFSHAFIYVFEEVIMDRFYIQPIELVGYEGLWGMLVCLIVIPIISFIPCKFGIQACVFTDSNIPFLQVPSAYVKQVSLSKVLQYFTLIGIASISISNIAGVNVTKHISALTRSICDVTRVILIWCVGSIITITLGTEYPNYVWQLVTVKAIAIQLIGFSLLIFGNLVYNGVIKLPGLLKKSIDAEDQKVDEFGTQKNIYEDDLSIIL